MRPPQTTSSLPPAISRYAPCLLLLIHATLGVWAALAMSVTHDEYWHLPAGLVAWQTGRFDADVLNPPLVRLWCTWPLAIAGVPSGYSTAVGDAGSLGDGFLMASGSNHHWYFVVARSMNVLLSLVCGWLIYQWVRTRMGDTGAIVALAAWCFEPNVLANAAVVTSDMGVALAFFGVFTLLTGPQPLGNWKQAVVVGVAIGAAQLTKFTAVLIVPLGVLWLLCQRTARTSRSGIHENSELPNGARTLTSSAMRGSPHPLPSQQPTELSPISATAATANSQTTRIKPAFLRQIVLVSVIALAAVATLNTGYLWQGVGEPIARQPWGSQALKRLRQLPEVFPNPLPRDYCRGVDEQKRIMESAHPVYLNGDWNTTGFRTYYLWALFYKTSVGFQVLILLGCYALVGRMRSGLDVADAIGMAVGILSLLVLASFSGMQIGVRYILPIMPWLCVLGGYGAEMMSQTVASRRWLAGTLLLLAIPVLSSPNFISFFNIWAGGTAGGRWCLVDSNFDWGQDLGALGEWARQHPERTIRVAYFGTLPPESVGLTGAAPPSHQPEPGMYAISVNYLQGRPHVIRLPGGGNRAVGLEEFGYFRFFEPTAIVGTSIYVFDLTPADVERYRRALAAMQAR